MATLRASRRCPPLAITYEQKVDSIGIARVDAGHPAVRCREINYEHLVPYAAS